MKNDMQLRLHLMALHRRVVLLGPPRNFLILLVFLAIASGTASYFFPSMHNWTTFVIFIVTFSLYNSYFIELPATKGVLEYFEHNHPEMCSWLKGSALLEATMMNEQK